MPESGVLVHFTKGLLYSRPRFIVLNVAIKNFYPQQYSELLYGDPAYLRKYESFVSVTTNGQRFSFNFWKARGKLNQEYDPTNGVKPAGPEYKPSKPAGAQP